MNLNSFWFLAALITVIVIFTIDKFKAVDEVADKYETVIYHIYEDNIISKEQYDKIHVYMEREFDK